MDILLDGRLLDLKNNTGISRYTQFFAEYYLSRGFSVSLILNDKANLLEGCTPVYTDLRPYNIFDFHKFPCFVETISSDILHIPFYSGLSRKLKSDKKQIFITVHDLMYHLVDDFFGSNKILNRIKKAYFDYIVKKSLRNSDNVISVSYTTQTDLKKIFSINSIVIPEYSQILDTRDDSILEKLSLPPKSYYFYCGNNRNHKNISFIREVFSKSYKDFPLVLAGKGHLSGENIVTTGVVTDGELRSLYANARAFIFPSSYEGFGLPILESLHCKTPVICSDIPAFREFDSENIEFFKVNDKTSLLSAITKLNNRDFKGEPEFFDYYSKKNIYKILDSVILK